jgi:hypothetical protein
MLWPMPSLSATVRVDRELEEGRDDLGETLRPQAQSDGSSHATEGGYPAREPGCAAPVAGMIGLLRWERLSVEPIRGPVIAGRRSMLFGGATSESD